MRVPDEVCWIFEGFVHVRKPVAGWFALFVGKNFVISKAKMGFIDNLLIKVAFAHGQICLLFQR